MRILITNDDGINAPGLEVAEAIGAEIAGEGGEVWTVAPAFEQSGVGHCISYVHPTMVSELGERRWAAEGSPADCVLAGIHDILPDRPDLILSGVNRGNNAAENVVYSGTIGGAMEGALQGIPSIALSQFLGPATRELDNPFEGAAQWGARVVRAILDARPDNPNAYSLFYNVNFPPCAASDVAGIRVCPQGRRPDITFTTERHHAPSGRRFTWIRGGAQQVASADGTDAALNLEGYVSVTPLRADLTAHDTLASLRDAIDSSGP
ncbi:5'-nucleotidase /3'-nucleotidase /exopolyphosphatase [Palleronia aestuarii]|uniref:5'-nucleotidase SurE n=1 Tax=Palleronia aestuarii TaxID=568105 RepID=A0A2W7NJR7_9RHOB|nr:5'/3'-nucleotidase SurE [Palleronia aestuarii]PZX18317.1 5'-nucleotidase /3'-nucleotidase /exopolyphosphatase [Palleronia aestuarii]